MSRRRRPDVAATHRQLDPGSRGPLAAVRRRLIAHHPTAHHPTGDAGSITLLTIAFGVLALLLMTAVVSATSIHLEQKRLVALADQLALEAADALDLAAFYRGEAPPPTPDGVVPLTDADVRRAVTEYLADHPQVVVDVEGLRVVEAATDDGRTARVTLAALARPPLISSVTAAWSDGIALTATASARAW